MAMPMEFLNENDMCAETDSLDGTIIDIETEAFEFGRSRV